MAANRSPQRSRALRDKGRGWGRSGEERNRRGRDRAEAARRSAPHPAAAARGRCGRLWPPRTAAGGARAPGSRRRCRAGLGRTFPQLLRLPRRGRGDSRATPPPPSPPAQAAPPDLPRTGCVTAAVTRRGGRARRRGAGSAGRSPRSQPAAASLALLQGNLDFPSPGSPAVLRQLLRTRAPQPILTRPGKKEPDPRKRQIIAAG